MMKILIFLIAIYLIQINGAYLNKDRSFVIDYENDRFLKDGESFRYISGSLHYYRVPNEYWEDRLRKYKKAGLNTVQTYIEWSLHEPVKGHYNFDGDANLFKFIELAQKNDLLVILRAGPYECAERDNGGLPYWLKQLNLNTKVRTSDRLFMQHVEDWFNYLMPKLRKYLYKNGGPVLMIQIENEYGSYYACDFNYQIQLKKLIQKNLNDDVILFTTDGNGDNYFKCGKIASVLPAIDFGTSVDPVAAFKTLRNHLPQGPLINNEFYPGWLDHWSEKHNKITSKATCDTLDSILALNASVNVYVMHGGTNFGFTAGANSDGNNYQPQPTSYDYDAPINEYGNLTQKYFDIQKIISQYGPTEDVNKNDFVELIVPPPVELSLLKQNLLDLLLQQKPKKSNQTLTFETLGVQYGYVLYKTTINFKPTVPIQLTLKNLKDRAYIYVDNVFQAILDRAVKIETAPVIVKQNSELMILVENQGRVNFGILTGETKGISEVYLGNRKLEEDRIYKKKFHLHYGTYDWEKIYEQVNNLDYQIQIRGNQQYKPRFFKGEFVLNEEPKDTLIDLTGWSKGVAFVNGHNLGRYWPEVGPQVSLYVPGVWLMKGSNTIILLEKEEDNCRKNNCSISFTDKHMIDSEVPNSS